MHFPDGARGIVQVFDTSPDTCNGRRSHILGGPGRQNRVEYLGLLALPDRRRISLAVSVVDEQLLIQAAWLKLADGINGWRNMAVVKSSMGVMVATREEDLGGVPRVVVAGGDPDRVRIDTLLILPNGRDLKGDKS